MNENNKLKYDQFTVGKSPAAIYLMDVLNESDNIKNNKVISMITKFRKIFKQLLNAYEQKNIDNSIIHIFCAYKRKEIIQQQQDLEKDGVDSLVIKLYSNIVIADMKKFTRIDNMNTILEKSAVDRAKNNLKQKHLKFSNQSVKTFAKIKSKPGQTFDVTIEFNEHGIPIKTNQLKNSIDDNITDEILMEKSLKRRERKKL